jgi:hypothetical protein
VHQVTDAGATVADEGERAAEFGTAVAGGDVSEHRHGRGRQHAVRAPLDDLGAFRQFGTAVGGQQRDELLAQRVQVLLAGERALADEVLLLLRHHPVHAG